MKEILYSRDFERAILSTVIFDSSGRETVFASSLTSKDFYFPFHQNLFVALQDLNEQSAIEESIIKQHMGKKFDEVQMLDILAALPLSNVSIYIEEVKEFSRLRQVEQLAHKILMNIEEEKDVSKVLHLVHEELERVEGGVRNYFPSSHFLKSRRKKQNSSVKAGFRFPGMPYLL